MAHAPIVGEEESLRAAEARREKKNAYYEANRERLLEKKREYYRNNREARLEYNKKYYDANRDTLVHAAAKARSTSSDSNASRRAKYAEDAQYRERIREAARKWRETNDKHATAQKEAHAANPAVKLLRTAELRAKRHGIPFNLCVDDVVVPDACPVLGMPLRVNRGKVGRDSPSLDRIHPDRGYVKGNVQVISYKANTMKHNATPQELLAFAYWSTSQFGLYGERLTKEEMELKRQTGAGI